MTTMRFQPREQLAKKLNNANFSLASTAGPEVYMQHECSSKMGYNKRVDICTCKSFEVLYHLRKKGVGIRLIDAPSAGLDFSESIDSYGHKF